MAEQIDSTTEVYERWQSVRAAFRTAVDAERHEEASGLADAMEAAGRALIDTSAAGAAEIAMKLCVVAAILDEDGSRDGWERGLLRSSINDVSSIGM